MENSATIQDIIVENLKKEKGFYGVINEVSGFRFSAADFVVSDGRGNCEVYRVAVIKHGALFNSKNA